MRKERILKKALGLALCFTTAAAALAGCGKDTGGDSLVDQATKNSKEYVFKRSIIDLGGKYDCNSITLSGDKLYVSSYSETGYLTVLSLNSDGSNVQTAMKIPQKDNESHGLITFDNDGNMYSVFSIYPETEDEEVVTYEEEGNADGDATAEAGTAENGAKAIAEAQDGEDPEGKKVAEAPSEGTAEDGDATAQEPDTDPEAPAEGSEEALEENGDGAMGFMAGDEDEQKYLVKYDPQGNEIYRIDLMADLKDDEDYFYAYSMVYDDNAGIIISTDNGIQTIDESTKTLKTLVDLKDPSLGIDNAAVTIVKGFEGKLFANYWGDNGLVLRTFDAATGKFGEPSKNIQGYGDMSFFGGNGYDLYMSNQDGFYGYDLASDNKTKLLDYSDSDIGVNYSVPTAVAISDNEFVANLPDEEYNYMLTRLTKIPADQVKDRTVITLAGNYIDYNIRSKVYKFNDENQDYKIKLVDYSSLITDGDYSAGATQFNLDIVSGNVPDIMFFTNEEPVDSYINKGLFLDLSTYIKNDPDLKNAEFIENVFDAFKTGDKIYQLVPSFYITSYATKTSYLKGKEYLTLQDCKDMIQAKNIQYSDAFGLTSRDEMLYQGLLAGGDSFIDWENKTCNFNSDDFINFIEFVKQFPESLPDDAWDNYNDAAYREGKSLFSIAYINGFRNYKRYVDGTFGEPVSLIGFPNEMGTNRSVLIPNSRLCISAKSKYADVAWQLLRQFYLEDYQDKMEYEFPILKSSFDKMAETSKERPFWIDDEGEKHYQDDVYWLGDQEIKVSPLNQQEVDYVKDFIYSLDNTYNANTNVYNIITEEVAPFFSGQKTAKEVADIIQSRVSIYVNENS
jgi:hypothetical protein